MVIALISGISRLDLGTETTETSVCPLSRLDRQEVDGVRCLSLVVGSFRPQRFDVLRRQKVDGSVSTAVRHLSAYVWFCEEVVATVTVTFLMSSAQLQALISPFPALRR